MSNTGSNEASQSQSNINDSQNANVNTEPYEQDNGSAADYSDEYIMPDADIRVYESWEIADFDEHDTQMAINELFARHGRIFKDDDVRRYFNNISWYYPEKEEVDPKEEFNSCEYQNYNLLCNHRDELKKND